MFDPPETETRALKLATSGHCVAFWMHCVQHHAHPTVDAVQLSEPPIDTQSGHAVAFGMHR